MRNRYVRHHTLRWRGGLSAGPFGSDTLGKWTARECPSCTNRHHLRHASADGLSNDASDRTDDQRAAIAVASRLIQGLALGVEVGASTAVPLECVPAGRGAVYTSWQGAPPIPPWWVVLTSLQEVKAEL